MSEEWQPHLFILIQTLLHHQHDRNLFLGYIAQNQWDEAHLSLIASSPHHIFKTCVLTLRLILNPFICDCFTVAARMQHFLEYHPQIPSKVSSVALLHVRKWFHTMDKRFRCVSNELFDPWLLQSSREKTKDFNFSTRGERQLPPPQPTTVNKCFLCKTGREGKKRGKHQYLPFHG